MSAEGDYADERARRYKAEVLRNYVLKGDDDGLVNFVKEIEVEAATRERWRFLAQIAKAATIVVVWIIGSMLIAQWVRPYDRIVEWMT